MRTATPQSPSAAVWNVWEEDGQMFRLITDTELMHFTHHFLIRRGQVAVDAGCGTGAFSRQLHRFGFDVTGVDFAENALAAARRTCLPAVRYLHHDLNAGDPPALPQHGIDLVVCRLVLPFLKDPAAWLRRVRDHWLRPGGRMYVVVPVIDEPTPQPGAMTEAEVADLAHGWAHAYRYDLRGHLACLMLRSPAT
ncbi:class I SAM-dependent methyltransferase [Streptomyces sp. NPDC052236]|uniref:class I SAM-dependent methyltransferase n=1 Tax=Streptomyces sp. NPDC052236 TaxID=3365686 RepID=UPI0037D38F90